MNAVHIIYYRMESAVILSQIGLLHWAMLDVVDETYVEKVSFKVSQKKVPLLVLLISECNPTG